MNRRRAVVLASCAAVALCGCASTPVAPVPTKTDPWEAWNRKVFAFNDAIDEAVLKPVAEGYRKVVPSLVRTGIDNALGNVGDLWSAANQFLQGKVQYGFEMGMRVLTNTFFGLGGLLDPASEMRLPRRSEDFGQTLARSGIGDGPFVMLPFLGPSTLRDTFALPADLRFSPGRYPPEAAERYAVTALGLVNTRSNLLATTALVGEVALDRYSFFRDGYLARRRDQIYDGAPPLENFDDDDAGGGPPPK